MSVVVGWPSYLAHASMRRKTHWGSSKHFFFLLCMSNFTWINFYIWIFPNLIVHWPVQEFFFLLFFFGEWISIFIIEVFILPHKWLIDVFTRTLPYKLPICAAVSFTTQHKLLLLWWIMLIYCFHCLCYAASVPDPVKAELLQRIRSFLASTAT